MEKENRKLLLIGEKNEEESSTCTGLVSGVNPAKKRKSNSCELPSIPQDLIFKILERLPAKSLMRFKTVCKSWHALIRDPYFAESHHIRSQTRPDSSYLLVYLNRFDMSSVQAIFPASPDGVLSTQLPLHSFNSHHRFEPCTNIVNGLICLWAQEGARLELLNLTTREQITLPRGKPEPFFPDWVLAPSYCFLGFDPIRKQYKVLYFRPALNKTTEKRFIITLGAADLSWRELTDSKLQFKVSREAICVDGGIYWRNTSKLFVGGERVLPYFDVGEEKFKLLPIHDLVGNKRFDSEFVTEIGGKLTLGGMLQRSSSKKCSKITLGTLINREDRVWVKSKTQLPKSLVAGRQIRVVGGTNRAGEVLLKSKALEGNFLAESWDTLIFCGFRKKNEKKNNYCRTVKVGCEGKSSDQLLAATLLSMVTSVVDSHHVENILPLNLPNQPPETERRRCCPEIN